MAFKTSVVLLCMARHGYAMHHDRSGSGIYNDAADNMLIEGQLCSVHVLFRELANPGYGVSRGSF
jgi:hypothetical protein